jgi:hypothetical protein
MIRKLSAFGATLLLAGCALDLGGGGNGPELAGNIISYSCEDDRSFTAAFDQDMENVSIGGSGDTHRLQLSDRDGNRRVYTADDGDVSLTVQGGEASLRMKGEENLQNCQASS